MNDNGNIVPLHRTPLNADPFDADALRTHIAQALSDAGFGTEPSLWAGEAIALLKECVGDQRGGSAVVSVTAVHFALGYIEHLESRLGTNPTQDGAA